VLQFELVNLELHILLARTRSSSLVTLDQGSLLWETTLQVKLEAVKIAYFQKEYPMLRFVQDGSVSFYQPLLQDVRWSRRELVKTMMMLLLSKAPARGERWMRYIEFHFYCYGVRLKPGPYLILKLLA